MQEEEQINEVSTNAEESALLKEYKKLQESTVSKEKYEKDINELKEKNQIYLKAITEGSEVAAPEENSGSVQDAIADLSKFQGTNLEYWQKMNKAIDKAIAALPESEITKMIGTDGFEQLIKVNEATKEMVKDANGDPDYFRTLYRQRVQDSAPRISSDIEKAGGLGNYFESLQNK